VIKLNKGIAYLIGAGPGDYKLITLKGMECIKKADVLLYDRLVSDKLLSFASEDAELIFVGKSPDNHAYSQEEINKLLVKKALEGKTIVRLKGGDPFVFGRGSEEALALKEAGIYFEIIPGVTSAIAVPAYAGIPVTHRKTSSSLHIITGHEDPEKDDTNLNYQVLAKLEGTLVFLMGIQNLKEICSSLILHGQPEDRPVAVIMNGTTSRQRKVFGTLKNIHEILIEQRITNPSVVVVGDVVGLSETLSWFENKPLFGKRILVTRTRQQVSSLTQKIEELGGEVIEFPTIQIVQPDSFDEIDGALGEIEKYQWIIFTSVNGVNSFFNRLKKLDFDIRLLYNARICAIGSVTAKTLEDMGFNIEYVPEVFKAEELVEGLKNKIMIGDRVLLPRADIGGTILVDELNKLGAEIDDIHVYKTVISKQSRDQLQKNLENNIDIITFTSSSTVNNFIQILGKDNLPDLSGIKFAAIGPVTEETAHKAGLKIDILAEDYTIDGLVSAIVKHVIKGEIKTND